MPTGQTSVGGVPATREPETVKLALSKSSSPAVPLPGIESGSKAEDALTSAMLATVAPDVAATVPLIVRVRVVPGGMLPTVHTPVVPL